MADLVQRTDNALNEARVLMLLGQVLFAYAFESVFEKSFVDLPGMWFAVPVAVRRLRT